MVFQTGGKIKEGFQVGGEIVTSEEPEIRDDFFSDYLVGARPIEDWLPTEHSEVAQKLLDSFDDPENERTRLASTILLSEMFGMNFHEIEILQPEMMKKIFGDELVRISERFKKEPVEGGFFKKVAESWRRGDRGVMSDIAVYEAVFEGYGNEKETLEIHSKIQLEQLLSPIEGGFFADLVYSGVEVIPGMARGYWGAIPIAFTGMATGAGMAAAAGQIPPLTLVPEEAITVPVGATLGLKAGLMTGSAMFWYKQGAGSMYASMREKGYDPELSKHIAGVAAIPYAIVEFLQVAQLTPGLRQGALQTAQKGVLRVLGNATKRYGTTWTEEVFEEVIQEIIQVVAEDTAGFLSNKLKLPEGVSGFLLERGQRVWETTKEAGKAMALLPIPGAIIDVRTGTKGIISAEAKAEINKKLKKPLITPAVALIPAAEPAAAVTKAVQPPAVAREAEITPPERRAEAEKAAKPLPAKEVTAEKELISEIITQPEQLPEGFNLIDRGPNWRESRFGYKNRFAITNPQGFVVKETSTSERAIKFTLKDLEKAKLPKPPKIPGELTAEERIEKDIREIKNTRTGELEDVRQDDIIDIIQDTLEKEGAIFTGRSAVSEAGYFEFEDKRIRIAAHGIARTESESDIFIGVGEGLLDADIQIPENATVQDIKNATLEAIGKIARPAAEAAEIEKQPPGLTKAEAEHLGKKQAEALRAGQKAGEQIGFKAGERASRERAKTEILKLKQAQKLTEGRRKTAVELVKAFIEKEKRGEFLKRVAEAKTPRDLEKITEAVEKGVVLAEKREAIGKLKTAVKAIKPKKMLPEFAATAQRIIDSFQLGKIKPETEVKNADLKEMAQQVLDTAREDSVAAFQAQQLLGELRKKTAKTFAINQLSVDAIEQITDTLTALRFQNEADTIAAKDENATEAIRRRAEIKKSIVEPPEISESIGGKGVKKFKLFHDNLESVLDSTAGARPGTYDLWKESKRATTEFIYDVLNKGEDAQIIHNHTARNIFRDILEDNGVSKEDILNWSMRPKDVSIVKRAFGFGPKPQVHKFTLEDTTGKSTEFDFTVNELMSIFMHARNSHNLAVILNDGMDRIIRGDKQKIRGFTINAIDDMIDTLTDQQKKVARQTGSKLMDGFNRDAINKTSVKLEFFELAKVENYWPARRSIIRTIKGKVISGVMKTIEAMGFLKERVGIGNPMRLSGFFETVHGSNKNVSTYVGLAEPLREVKSVYTTDVIESMENSGRADEAKLITDLIVRFEDQSSTTQPLDTVIKRMIGGFAKSKLFLNVKIAPRQQISELLISAYVETKYLAEFRGATTKKLVAEVGALSPQMKARFEGFQFDRDVGDAFVQNELMNYLTGDISLIDQTARGMKFFDTNAIIDVYRVAKAEVTDKNPGIDITSAEGKALLKDRFEWLVRHTQPMWHTKDRSLIGSDPRPLIRALTMFMSQREQLVRMVNNGISDYVNSNKTAQDATRLGKTLGSVALNLAMFTLYNFAWAVLIQKRKRETLDLAKSFVKDILSLPFFGKYIAKSFEITFNVFADKPIFRQEFDEGAVEGILKEILIDAIPNYARAGKHFVTKEKYISGPNRGEEKWKNELFVATDSLAEAIASLKGVPYYGAKDIAKTIKAQLTEDEKQSVPRLKAR